LPNDSELRRLSSSAVQYNKGCLAENDVSTVTASQAFGTRLIAVLCVLWILFASALHISATGRQFSDSPAKPQGYGPAGTWRGLSKCLVKPSPCRDEDSLYRISAAAEPQGQVNLSANKVVDGKEVKMGSSECAYDPASHSIKCPLSNGSSMHLEVNGSAMTGKMILGDGTVWREITLRKAADR